MTKDEHLQVIADETTRLQKYTKDEIIYLYTSLLVTSMEMAESMQSIAASLSSVSFNAGSSNIHTCDDVKDKLKNTKLGNRLGITT